MTEDPSNTKSTVEIQIRGFPDWTEAADLKCTIDECGLPSLAMRILYDANNNAMAEARLPTWDAAESVVKQLHKFEFTPGYPLKARIKPGQTPPPAGSVPASAPRPATAGTVRTKLIPNKLPGAAGKGSSGKAAAPVPESSCLNAVGAGRIEGWFLHGKEKIWEKGFGYVQSFSFEGNLLFRPVNSPNLKNVEFQQKDPVHFEVMKLWGELEAVNLKPPEMEDYVDPDDVRNSIPAYWAPSEPETMNQAPTVVSQKRRMREESDGRWLFFGNFGSAVTEEVLWKFAEQAGPVVKVKLFYHMPEEKVSKGCGKVMYETDEGADKAVNELTGTVLGDRIVVIERLGATAKSLNPKQKQQRVFREDITDDMPKQLPLSMFAGCPNNGAKLDVCYAAFESLLYSHDESTGFGLPIMIRRLIMEVNDIFQGDETSLRKFADHLRSYPWFAENMQAVKWQASKGRVMLAKQSTHQPQYMQNQRSRNNDVEQRKMEQEMMGKPIFQLPEAGF